MKHIATVLLFLSASCDMIPNVYMRLADGGSSSGEVPPVPPVLYPPQVTDLSELAGQVGDFVTITGLYFANATSVKFNGTAAVFSIIDDTSILTTVPSAATTGVVTVVNADGTGTGPSFTVEANNFAFNFDAETMPDGITGTRTGDPIGLARNSGTSLFVEDGLGDLYEQREDIAGQWTMPATTNEVPDPTDFVTDWVDNGSVQTPGQPDPTGGNSATLIADADASKVIALYSPDNASDTYDPCASIWVRDDENNPPTDTGAIGAYDGGGGYPKIFCGILTTQNLGTGPVWKRRHGKIGTSAGHGAARCLFSPTGQTPVYNAYCTQHASAVGGRYFYGAMASGGPTSGRPGYDAPLVFGSTSARVLAVDGDKLPDLVNANGDVDIEGRFYLPDIQSSQTLDEMRIFTIDVGGEVTSASLTQSIAWTWKFKSDSPIGASFSYGLAGQLLEWRLLYKPSENKYGFGARFNGCIAYVDLRSGVITALGTPDAAYLGCDETGSGKILPALHTLLRKANRSALTIYDAEGVILGDSTMAPYLGALALVGSLIYTSTEAAQRLGLLSLAASGNTAVDQLAAWQASPARGNANVAWVSVAVGINDIGTGASTATIRTRIQAIVDDINANNPDAKVILVPMIPFGFTAGFLTIWQGVNTSIIGGASPITGSNLIRMPLWTELDNGSGALKPEYLGVDDHNNDLSRTSVMGPDYRQTLIDNGLL